MNFCRQTFKALKIVWTAAANWINSIIVLDVILAGLPLLSYYLLQTIIDKVTQNSAVDTRVMFLIAEYAIVLIAISFLNAVIRYLDSGFNLKVQDYISSLVINKSSKIPYHYFEDSRYMNSLHFVQQESIHRPTQLASAFRGLLSNGFMLFSLSIFFTTLHWSIGVILLILAIPSGWIKYYLAEKMFNWRNSTQELRRKSGYFNRLLTTAESAKEIRLFNLGDRFTQIYRALQKKLLRQNLHLNKKEGKATLAIEVLEKLAMIGLILFILYQNSNGIISVGAIVVYIQAMQKGQSTVKTFVQSISTIFSHQLFIQRLLQFLNFEEDQKNDKSKAIDGPVKEHGFLEINHLSFTYPNAEKEVLADISVSFKKGEITAIVGENGSGKSTLIKIICGLFQPSKGEIRYNGQSIHQMGSNEWFERLGVIFQDFNKFHFQFYQNICLFDDNFNELRYQQSIEISEADMIQDSLKKGKNTLLGKSFRGGQELSQGQWQRVALARALYKNGEVIILDEPTSAVDPLSEDRIFDHFKKLAKDKILILVTHRIYNLQIADQILVMDHGKLLQRGTHRELIRQSGRYSEMFDKQKVEQ